MLELLKQPWPWYVAGVLIGLTVPTLLIIGNKAFGISSSLRHICAACMPANLNYLQYKWKNELWNLYFVGGIVLGGIIASTLLKDPNPIKIAAHTQAVLKQNSITDFKHSIPTDLFAISNLFSLRGFIFMIVGGFLVGFGTRYAGGCTSGHSITGLSNLQWPSLVSTICFMAGGFIVTWLVIPFLLTL